jgi:hypothetical protein
MSRPIRLGNIALSFHAVSAAVVQRILEARGATAWRVRHLRTRRCSSATAIICMLIANIEARGPGKSNSGHGLRSSSPKGFAANACPRAWWCAASI